MPTEKPYLPTAEEIRLLQDLAPGWDDVWGHIVAVLIGRNEDGRLYVPARRVMQKLGLPPRDDRINDCVNTIYMYFMQRIKSKELFADFNLEEYDGVYAWLCNPTNIWIASSEFRKEFRSYKSRYQSFSDFIKPTIGSPGSRNKDGEETKVEDTIESQSREIDDLVFARLEELISRLCREPLTIPLLPEDKKINRVTEYAGLQLYPRLDRAVEEMWRLIKHIHNAVRDAGPLYGEPGPRIEREHQDAEERISAELEDICRELLEKTRPRRARKLRRKESRMTFERFFSPLDTEQVMRLLGLFRDAVYQRRKEYKERLPKILRLDIKKDKELKKLLANLDILLEEEDAADE